MEPLMQAGKATASGSALWLPHAQLQLCLVLPCSNANSAHLHMQATDYPWKQTFNQGKTENWRSSYSKNLGQV